jgi:hypothetical protein
MFRPAGLKSALFAFSTYAVNFAISCAFSNEIEHHCHSACLDEGRTHPLVLCPEKQRAGIQRQHREGIVQERPATGMRVDENVVNVVDCLAELRRRYPPLQLKRKSRMKLTEFAGSVVSFDPL